MRALALSKSLKNENPLSKLFNLVTIIWFLWYLFYVTGKLKQIDFNLVNKFIKREAYLRALNSIILKFFLIPSKICYSYRKFYQI